MRVAFFLDGTAGKVFCTGVNHEGRERERDFVLLFPPFAEELNKSRHVLASLARDLGDAGFDVLLPDLYGTGDSEGEFGEATLTLWRQDIDTAIQHMQPFRTLHFVGLRTGALLAADAMSRHQVASLTLLQPLHEGREEIAQLLRLKVLGGLMGRPEKETSAQLKGRLEAGESIEIAGYSLSRDMARGLESLELKAMCPDRSTKVYWIELGDAADDGIPPESQSIIDAWGASGVQTESCMLICDAFWATQELAGCPGLNEKTLSYLHPHVQ